MGISIQGWSNYWAILMSIVNSKPAGLGCIMTPFNRTHSKVLGLHQNELGEKSLQSATDNHIWKGQSNCILCLLILRQCVGFCCFFLFSFRPGIVEFLQKKKNTLDKMHSRLTWEETMRTCWLAKYTSDKLLVVNTTIVCSVVIYRLSYLLP